MRVLAVLTAILLPATVRSEVKFRVIDGQASGLKPILEKLKADETARQGGVLRTFWPWGVRAVDLDKDGDADLIISYHGPVGSLVLKNQFKETGSVTFALWPNHPDNRAVPGVDRPLVIDYAKTSFPSLFAFPGDVTSRKDYLNNAGTLTPKASTTWNAHAATYDLRDVDGDVKTDVLSWYPGYGKTTLATLRNNGDGTFTKTSAPLQRPAGLPAHVTAALDTFEQDTSSGNRFAGPIYAEDDLNNDGRPDCLIRYWGGYAPLTHTKGWVLLRDAAGGLVDAMPNLPGMVVMPTAGRLDVDGDGRKDFFSSHADGAGLWLQQADGTFRNTGPPISTFMSARVEYQYQVKAADFDADGDLDLVISNARAKVAKVYQQDAPGVFVEKLHLRHYDPYGVDIGDLNADGKPDLVIGGPGLAPWPADGPMLNTDAVLFINESIPPAPVHRIPCVPYDLATPAAQRFLASLESAANGGTPHYGLQPWHAAQAYRMTTDERFAHLAHALAKAKADAALANIAAGSYPAWAGNSYLDSGRAVQDFCCVLDWCPSYVTEEERLEWMTLCETTVANIWGDPRQAQWGGKVHPWSGWAAHPPYGPNYGNNYMFSFLQATMYWGLLQPAGNWLTGLRTIHWPAVFGYYSAIPAGGSREGTGYGESQRTLLMLFRIWKGATGENLAAQLPWVSSSVDYWCSVTQPGGTHIVPVGDQTRDTSARVFDYHRHLLLEAGALLADDPRRVGHLRWWHANVKPRMSRPASYVWDLLATADVEQLPPPLAYAAPEVGDYFWRTGLDVDARMVTFRAGLYREAHAHQDQGSVHLWGRRKRLLTTANVWSRDGIRQQTPYHSLVRFERADGSIVPQKYGAEPSAKAWAATDDHMSASATFDPFYAGTGIGWTRRVAAWKRTAEHAEGYLTVEDDCVLPAGVTAHVQFQLTDEPVVVNDRQVMAGPLLIESADPVTWAVLDWRTVTSPTTFSAGWRLTASGRDRYRVKVSLQ